MARNPLTTWEMLDHAMQHYRQYLLQKKDSYKLTFIDLLFISNFKGGNASITEPVDTLTHKLDIYESQLKEIAKAYKNKTLQSLNEMELGSLVDLCNKFLKCTKDDKSKIRGFGPSYASALLSAHFLDVIPVLDRRILNGADISVEYNAQNQVKSIEKYYGSLIRRCHQKLKKDRNLSLRDLDMKWFTKSLPK